VTGSATCHALEHGLPVRPTPWLRRPCQGTDADRLQRRKCTPEAFCDLDIFRLDESGRIVQHWDVPQVVPDHSANENGVF